MRKLTIATRGSKLALWQAEHVKERILSTCQGVVEISLLVLKTKGDKILDVPLAKVGGKGLFVKEIEEALLDGRADLAVHSMKDMPVDLPSDLALGVITEREDPRDMFLSMRYPDLESIPSNGRIGTSSLRRQAQLLAFRPDIAIIPLRGNVDTRLRKLAEGEFDAIIMASAGMKRLGLSAPYMVPLPEATMLPAVGQGALGLEFRQDRPDIAAVLAPLDHEETRLCVMAERGFLAGLDGRCQAPMAAHAVVRNGTMTLKTLLCDPEGNRSFLEAADMEASLGAGAAFCLGRQIAEKTKLSGGDTLLAEIIGAAENNT